MRSMPWVRPALRTGGTPCPDGVRGGLAAAFTTRRAAAERESAVEEPVRAAIENDQPGMCVTHQAPSDLHRSRRWRGQVEVNHLTIRVITLKHCQEAVVGLGKGIKRTAGAEELARVGYIFRLDLISR